MSGSVEEQPSEPQHPAEVAEPSHLEVEVVAVPGSRQTDQPGGEATEQDSGADHSRAGHDQVGDRSFRGGHRTSLAEENFGDTHR
jgi:hypothetical protein